jgi:hypothetical protein
VLPYVNADLTAIHGVGTTADFDIPAAPGPTRWEGSLGIYVAEERAEVLSAEQQDEIIRTRLEIPYDIGRLVERGDTLTYTYEGAPVERLAGTITRAQLVGRVRVDLEDS